MVIPRKKPGILQNTYLWEVARGLVTVIKHLLRNLFSMSRIPTLEYPEVKRVLPQKFRGQPLLLKNSGGQLRCTACMLCAKICPAQCITVEGAEHPDPKIEKYPSRYEIDMLRCVFCGLCEEACPCGAITLHSKIYEMAASDPESFVYNKERLSKS